jgi:HEAT repeat protein
MMGMMGRNVGCQPNTFVVQGIGPKIPFRSLGALAVTAVVLGVTAARGLVAEEVGGRAAAPVNSYNEFAALDQQARLQAIDQLAWYGGAGASVLVDVVAAEEDATIRRAAVIALAHGAGELVEEALDIALGDADPIVRLEAVRALAVQDSASAMARLASAATEDADGLVRRAAVIALSSFDDREAKVAIRKASRDADPAVQDAARRILGSSAHSTRKGR